MTDRQDSRRHIDSSPIRQEGDKWVVHFNENDQSIGTVHVFRGYTMSGWDDAADIPEKLRIQCETHAVDQFHAAMAERVRQMLLAQMPPGSFVGVIPIRTKDAA